MAHWKRKLLRMVERFFGFQKVHQIVIKRSVLRDLCDMAKDAHPKEMVAFMSATKGVERGILVIDEIQLQAYQASTHSTSFNLHQLPTLTSIIGTLHSHPSSNRRPSGQDLRLFDQYGLIHAIVGWPYTTTDVTFYDKQGRRVPVTVKS